MTALVPLAVVGAALVAGRTPPKQVSGGRAAGIRTRKAPGGGAHAARGPGDVERPRSPCAGCGRCTSPRASRCRASSPSHPCGRGGRCRSRLVLLALFWSSSLASGRSPSHTPGIARRERPTAATADRDGSPTERRSPFRLLPVVRGPCSPPSPSSWWRRRRATGSAVTGTLPWLVGALQGLFAAQAVPAPCCCSWRAPADLAVVDRRIAR